MENDYGAVNVDRMLLSDLDGEHCDVEMVIGGDYDCHRRRLKTKLIAMGMSGYDRVLMEPSGIYDTDEFFDLLQEEPLNRWYQIGSVIAIVAADLPAQLSVEEQYLLAAQLSCAGAVLLSRTQEVSKERLQEVITACNEALSKFHCKKQILLDLVYTEDFRTFDDQTYEALTKAGYDTAEYVKLPVARENEFTTLFYMNVHWSKEELRGKVKALFAEKDCGNICRIKGFVPAEDGFYECNATPDQFEIKPAKTGQEILLVIGENLNREKIDSFFDITTIKG